MGCSPRARAGTGDTGTWGHCCHISSSREEPSRQLGARWVGKSSSGDPTAPWRGTPRHPGTQASGMAAGHPQGAMTPPALAAPSTRGQTDTQGRTDPPTQHLWDPRPSSRMNSPVRGVPAPRRVLPPLQKPPQGPGSPQTAPAQGSLLSPHPGRSPQRGREGAKGAGCGVPWAPRSIVRLWQGGWRGGARECQDALGSLGAGGRREHVGGMEVGGTPQRVLCCRWVLGNGDLGETS